MLAAIVFKAKETGPWRATTKRRDHSLRTYHLRTDQPCQHFAFIINYYDQRTDTVNQNKTVCKNCLTSAPYISGNATNASSHLWHHHMDKQDRWQGNQAKNYMSIVNAFQTNCSFASNKLKKITNAAGTCVQYVWFAKRVEALFFKTVDSQYAISYTYCISQFCFERSIKTLFCTRIYFDTVQQIV